MPIDIDVIESRIRDVVEVINELKRLTLTSICLHIAVNHFGLRPRSYTECFREVPR